MQATSEEVLKLEPVAVRYRTAAGLLECSESTVRKMVREGKLEKVKVGDDERVTTKSIKALAAA
jgi:excisionase family DNA binding protein